MEIDDYRDYEKASSALTEALRCLAKAAEGGGAKNAFQIQERQEMLNKKIAHIKKFLGIRAYVGRSATLKPVIGHFIRTRVF